MKVLIASLFLMGMMSCAHHSHKECKDGSCDMKNKQEKCTDENCKLEKKDCCKKKQEA